MKKYLLCILVLAVVFGGTLLLYKHPFFAPEYKAEIAYSDFITKVRSGQIKKVEITGRTIKLRTAAGEELETYNPGDPHLIDDLLNKKVKIKTSAPEQRSLLMEIFISWFPIVIIFAVFLFFINKIQKRQGGIENNDYKKK